ncbi:hypothetical protein KKA24_02995 [Patescibacteria group bacterium]|nr:hypothetical protein [Patescibacteria group bacterium]
MENVIIVNQNKLEEFKKSDINNIHVLADFDRTLTRAFVNGKKIASLISILRDENYLTPDYPKKAKTLFEKYHAIEMDFNISPEEKKEAMKEWWTKHFELLIASGLEKKDIEEAMKSNNLILRKGVEELLKILQTNNVPLIVLSSCGIGKESIISYLKHKELLLDNIYIISNSFNWSEDGKALSANEPVIHGMNKNQTNVNDFPEIFKEIKERKDVILLGDSLSDVDMITGFDYNNLIKIGFLNENVEENLERYKEVYDIIITNDSSIDFVNNLLKEIKS